LALAIADPGLGEGFCHIQFYKRHITGCLLSADAVCFDSQKQIGRKINFICLTALIL
jgi:hypothetical protein